MPEKPSGNSVSKPGRHTHPEFDAGFWAGVESVVWKPHPGVLHPVDQAFYDLTIKQRNRAWAENERLRSDLLTARNELENLYHVEDALQEALCWLTHHSSMPEAETLAERISKDVGLAITGCRECRA